MFSLKQKFKYINEMCKYNAQYNVIYCAKFPGVAPFYTFISFYFVTKKKIVKITDFLAREIQPLLKSSFDIAFVY